MGYEKYKEQYDIKNVFVYHQERDGVRILFGWKTADSLDTTKPFVLSKHDHHYDTSSKEYEWSLNQGNSISSIDDYKLWFKSMTGDDTKTFILKWDYNLEYLEEVRKKNSPAYKNGEGQFLLNIAHLIEDGKEFSQLSRNYSIVIP